MKALLLISGGFDSAVAGYLMQQKGVEVIAMHFSYAPFTDDSPEKKSRKCTEILGIKDLIVRNISKEIQDISKKCRHKYYFILTKRLMMKLAEQEAKKLKCDFLITGENLSQVSSQTLQNLNSITRSVKIQILRPLLTYDKIEILNIAKKIGTYDSCIGPEVCDVLGPKHPATISKLEDIEEEERFISSINQYLF